MDPTQIALIKQLIAEAEAKHGLTPSTADPTPAAAKALKKLNAPHATATASAAPVATPCRAPIETPEVEAGQASKEKLKKYWQQFVVVSPAQEQTATLPTTATAAKPTAETTASEPAKITAAEAEPGTKTASEHAKTPTVSASQLAEATAEHAKTPTLAAAEPDKATADTETPTLAAAEPDKATADTETPTLAAAGPAKATAVDIAPDVDMTPVEAAPNTATVPAKATAAATVPPSRAPSFVFDSTATPKPRPLAQTPSTMGYTAALPFTNEQLEARIGVLNKHDDVQIARMMDDMVHDPWYPDFYHNFPMHPTDADKTLYVLASWQLWHKDQVTRLVRLPTLELGQPAPSPEPPVPAIPDQALVPDASIVKATLPLPVPGATTDAVQSVLLRSTTVDLQRPQQSQPVAATLPEQQPDRPQPDPAALEAKTQAAKRNRAIKGRFHRSIRSN